MLVRKDYDFDPVEWDRKKQQSRELDAEHLGTGKKTRAQLWAENSFVPASWKPDRSRMPRL